jgi:hypothetical protein
LPDRSGQTRENLKPDQVGEADVNVLLDRVTGRGAKHHDIMRGAQRCLECDYLIPDSRPVEDIQCFFFANTIM